MATQIVRLEEWDCLSVEVRPHAVRAGFYETSACVSMRGARSYPEEPPVRGKERHHVVGGPGPALL